MIYHNRWSSYLSVHWRFQQENAVIFFFILWMQEMLSVILTLIPTSRYYFIKNATCTASNHTQTTVQMEDKELDTLFPVVMATSP